MGITDAPLIYLLRILGRRFVEDRCMQVASSLTFTTLLALVPVVTVALTVASAFPVFGSLIGQLNFFIVQNLLPRSVDTITTYAQQFSENAGHLTVVGVIILSVTALLLLFTMEGGGCRLWRLCHGQRLLQAVLVCWPGLTIGPLL